MLAVVWESWGTCSCLVRSNVLPLLLLLLCLLVSTGAPTAKEKEALQPAATSEVQALLSKVTAIAEAVGLSGADSRGGGAQGSHGRRRLPVGHIRALLSRASINAWVSVGVCARRRCCPECFFQVFCSEMKGA